jgi:serine/threonine protein kinase
MASYRYQNGDRPLDGFTIEQALGRGGFGEVYFAVSDSGRQVALKAVQNYEDIELRGISHCMNIKSPHLVSIFDVKHSERGDPFVIMEYVAGPSLRDLLDESPNGLGPEKAAWFIREIAKGIALLHDNGVVHRDLKPHNVFFEDGYVKVGDYSLSKVITASHRSGHTLTVGTVHYMAPEISVGRYDRTVDIYALGVLLYEMLTGQPPFVGETMGEVLMKHMAGDVDVSALDEPYALVVRKAMAKDPTERYQTVDELVADLFGSATVVDGVSTFSPNSLTQVAERAIAGAGTQAVPASSRQTAVKAADHGSPRSSRQVSVFEMPPDSTPYHLGRLWSRAGAALCLAPARYADRPRRSDDPIPARRRVAFGLVVLSTMAFISNGYFQGTAHGGLVLDNSSLWGQFLITWAIVCAAKLVGSWMPGGSSGVPSLFSRLATTVGAFVSAMMLQEMFDPLIGRPGSVIGGGLGDGTVPAAVLPLLVMDWQWLSARSRPGRIRLTPCLAAALIAAMATGFTDGDPLAAVAIVASAALAVQAVSEYDATASRRLHESVKWLTSAREALGAWYGVQFPDIAAELKSLDRPESERRRGYEFGEVPAGADSRNAETIARPLPSPGNSVRASLSDKPDSQESIALEPADGPVSRISALSLCLLPFVTFGVVPICGLHRFLTGRTGTGLLWMLTLGLAGVGQLVDLILIALGEFRDGSGRPLRNRANSEAVNGLSSVPAASPVSNGMAVLGGLSLTITVLVGFLLAIDVPEMIATNVFRGFDLAGSDLEGIFGTKSWPELLRELLQLLTGILAVISAGLLIASRRAFPIRYVLNVPLAAVPFAIAFALLMEAFFRVQWNNVAIGLQEKKIGLILEEFLGSNDFIPSSLGAAVAFTAALLMLAQPPGQTFKQPAAQQVPVKQEA